MKPNTNAKIQYKKIKNTWFSVTNDHFGSIMTFNHPLTTW